MHGFLNIHKPSGVTSRTVVDAVLRVVGKGCKIGHAGTLDPLASGVLVVAIGDATRLIEYVHRGPKEYIATFWLDATSDSDDLDSPLTPVPCAARPSFAFIETVGNAMCGRQMQRPPAFSAIKLNGKRCYERARRGELVEIPARPVDIYAFELLEYGEFSPDIETFHGENFSSNLLPNSYPFIRFRLRCGSGTYVRSFGRDLAERLGTKAVMASLTRTAVGPFELDRSICLPEVLKLPNTRRGEPPLSSAMSELRDAQMASALRLFQTELRPVEWGVTYLPRMVLPTSLGRRLQMGQVVSFATCKENQAIVTAPAEGMPRYETLHRDRQQDGSNAIVEAAIAVFDPSEKLMSIVAPFQELHGYRAIRNFPPPDPLSE